MGNEAAMEGSEAEGDLTQTGRGGGGQAAGLTLAGADRGQQCRQAEGIAGMKGSRLGALGGMTKTVTLCRASMPVVTQDRIPQEETPPLDLEYSQVSAFPEVPTAG